MPTVSWTDRVWREFHANNLTRAYRDVLLTIRTYRGHGGLIVPAHATLAARANCSVRTVQRALGMGCKLGLVSWVERRVRSAWRWLRTSNSYRLETPAEPVQPGSRLAWPCRATNGQSDREEEIQKSKKKALAEMLRVAAELPDLLVARRRVIEARLLNGWKGGGDGVTKPT